MGVVYEAQDTRLPRSVAIKFLKPTLAKNVEAMRRFKREARLASSLNHPNICTILDVDEGDGQSFIAMELLKGRSLKERLATGPMKLEEILEISTQVADALAAAHDQGIMHRDITPGNIFVTEANLVKLLDFGLAKHFASLDGDEVTDDVTQNSGAVAGTIHYMAPEQFVDGAVVDHRCDLYSFGAVLYQMATGARPFEARSKNDIIGLILDHAPIPLKHLSPHQPVQLERIIDKLLAKNPDDRYDNAWSLRADLEAARQHGARPLAPLVKRPRDQEGIAVLPFEIIGPRDSCSEQFRDGLVEDISQRLTQLRTLRVAPRTSTRQAAGGSIRSIGSRLGVRMVLEGSVQQADGRIRVIANLVAAATEESLRPAVRVECGLDDRLTAQEEVARQVVDALSASLSPPADRDHTHDPVAFHAFKRGQQHWKSCFSGGWRPAIEQFQYAVERDGRFAQAHVALAAAYNFLGMYCLMKPNLAFDVGRQSVERALEIDDTLAPAHAELALGRFGREWDWEGSEQAFRRSLQLDPANAVTHVYYSWLLTLLGRDDAALGQAKAGHDLAARSRFVAAGHAQTLYLAKRYDEAIELCSECLEVDPTFVFALSLRGQCLELKSMFKAAAADLERAVTLSHRVPFYLGMLGHCYGKSGMRAEALDLIPELDRLSRETYVPPQCYVFIYAGLGEGAKALGYQERAYQDGASPFNYLTPNIRELYALDPQHKKRLEQMRLLL
jgi:TolB-like protein/tRNA A-37 threonylcarbamoyl transferase component Bud32